MTLEPILLYGILPLLSLAGLLVLARLVRGPDLPDRVVSLDLLATIIIAISAVYAIITGEPAYLDIAVILALIVFLGTIAFAYYIQRARR